MHQISQDLRHGLRMMLKNPGFTVVAVITLALGIGANTAIFTVVNAVLLRPLAYPDDDRLVMVSLTSPQQGLDTFGLSVADFMALRYQTESFENVATAFTPANGFALTGSGEAEQITATIVSADFFSTLKITPSLGRFFYPDEDRSGSPDVVVLSYDFWRRHFNSKPDVIGQSITLSGEAATILGVLPKDFRFVLGETADVWPIGNYNQPRRRGPFFLTCVGRLKPSVSEQQAQADVLSVVSQVQQQFSGKPLDGNVSIVRLKEHVVKDIRLALLILLGAVAFVLLMASLNVANLMLARANVREREVAIRSALGASRGRLVRQFMTESVLLAFIGGALGVLLAYLGVRLLSALSPGNIPRLAEISIDVSVLGFTSLIALLSSIIFGLAPALISSNSSLNELLKEGGKTGSVGPARRRLRNALVVLEIAMALVVLIGAGLLLNSFMRLQRINPGVSTENIVTMRTSLPQAQYREGPKVAGFYQQLVERLQSLPGVQAVAVSTAVPPDLLAFSNSFVVEGQSVAQGEEAPTAGQLSVSPDYFRAMGINFVAGRSFTESDKIDSPPVVIINRTMARRIFPDDEEPIGKRIQRGGPNPSLPWSTVIGVVEDVKYRALDAKDESTIYVPLSQVWSLNAYVVLKSSMDPQSLVSAARNEVSSLERGMPISKVKTMEQLIYESVATPRFRTVLLVIFGVVALSLAALGIYGLMSYSVSQRTQEIGIRMALGAQRGDILRLVMGQGLVLTLIGLGIGSGGAALLTRIFTNLLYGINATDPITFVLASLVLGLVALLASFVPASRATAIDPGDALRYQ